VGETGSGSFQVASFGISGVEPSASATRLSVVLYGCETWYPHCEERN
jgi:hypothetical protein